MYKTFDKKLLSEFRQILDDNEKILWIGKLNRQSFLAHIVTRGIIGLVLLIVFLKFEPYIAEKFEDSAFFIHHLVLFIVLPGALFTYLGKIASYYNDLYGFSDKRIITKSGFLETSFQMVDYDRIISIKVKRTMIDKYFNTGTIIFDSGRETEDSDGDVHKEYDKWSHIEDVYEVLKKVKKMKDNFRSEYNYPN